MRRLLEGVVPHQERGAEAEQRAAHGITIAPKSSARGESPRIRNIGVLVVWPPVSCSASSCPSCFEQLRHRETVLGGRRRRTTRSSPLRTHLL